MVQINGFPCNDIRVGIDVINAAQLGCKKLTMRAHCRRIPSASKRKNGLITYAPNPSSGLSLTRGAMTRHMLTRAAQISALWRVVGSTFNVSQGQSHLDPDAAPRRDDTDLNDWQWWQEQGETPREGDEPLASPTTDSDGDATADVPTQGGAEPDLSLQGEDQSELERGWQWGRPQPLEA